MLTSRLALVALVCLVACEPATTTCPQVPTENKALRALFDEEWEWSLREFPEWASTIGDHRYDDRWNDVSLAAWARRAAHDRELLARASRFDGAALPREERLSLDLFRARLENALEAYRLHLHVFPVNQLDGVQQSDQLAQELPPDGTKGLADWNARLRAMPAHVDQVIELLQAGIDEKLVYPRVAMDRVTAQIHALVVDDPAASTFFEPYKKRNEPALAAEAKKAIAESVVPAFRKLETFWKEKYLPACPTDVAAESLPNGVERYAHQIRVSTTTKLSPDDIHAIGLREVVRIRGEMEAAKTRAGFSGTLAELFTSMRTDKRFFYANREELLAGYRETAKRIDPELARMFRKLPRTSYGVMPIPDNAAPDAPTAYYHELAEDGSRAGYFFVNLYRPETRPKWEMTALTMHEAVPGHHLQIALATEEKGIPAFRRHGDYNAFVEGWALYAESLGDELGLYSDPYSKLGQLNYEMWRAVRLVVDTGLHHLKWDRQRAVDFFRENTGRSELDIGNEVDRYIVWPGQALGYKIGELRIKELRRRKQAQLGAAFDVRAFHDWVLRSGPVPLDVLEREVMDAR